MEIELRGAHADGPISGRREGRRAERRRVDAEQEVMHDRVADDAEVEDVGRLDLGPQCQVRDEPVDGATDGPRHLGGPAFVEHRVADPAHEVLAEPDLGVHDPGRPEHRA